MDRSFLSLTLVLLILGCTNPETSNTNASMQVGKNYPVYGGNKAGNRYSPLDQINTNNVNELEVAWMYKAAEISDGNESGQRANQIHCL